MNLTSIFAWLRALPANEPVLIGQAVGGALTIGATLGLHLTPPQIAGVTTGVTVATGFVLRSLVSPAAPAAPPPPPPVTTAATAAGQPAA